MFRLLLSSTAMSKLKQVVMSLAPGLVVALRSKSNKVYSALGSFISVLFTRLSSGTKADLGKRLALQGADFSSPNKVITALKALGYYALMELLIALAIETYDSTSELWDLLPDAIFGDPEDAQDMREAIRTINRTTAPFQKDEAALTRKIDEDGDGEFSMSDLKAMQQVMNYLRSTIGGSPERILNIVDALNAVNDNRQAFENYFNAGV